MKNNNKDNLNYQYHPLFELFQIARNYEHLNNLKLNKQ